MTGKELIASTRPFAVEDRGRSARHVVTTFALLAMLVAAAAHPWAWPLRLTAAVLAGLLAVRAFILYHDHLHGALLPTSTVARLIFWIFGVVVLAPPRVWRQSHNYHHAHTAQLVGSHVGSFPTMTVEMWRGCSRGQRLAYRLARHPLTLLLGVLTVFAWGMCLSSAIRNPRRLWDGALALAAHAALGALLWWWGGALAYLFMLLLPLGIASALGSYLFYAQHNFPGMHLQPRSTWEYSRAALESSSWMKTGPVLGWVTGNIGLHQVHHLNPGVPFYRLPEALAAIPELQHAPTTSLRPSDVAACLRLKLWDPARGEMVGFPR